MTNREAIDILTNIKNTPRVIWTNGADMAFDLAIKALEERPTGEWIIVDDMANKEIGCTQCPYAGHIELKECPDAYTKVSKHCNLYKHEPLNGEEE